MNYLDVNAGKETMNVTHSLQDVPYILKALQPAYNARKYHTT